MELLCSSSVLLDREEVFAFKSAVLGQVSAVNRIAGPISAKACPQCVGSQILGNLGVHGSHQISEALHSVLLSDFQNKDWPSGHLLAHLGELGKNTLIDFQELLSCWSVQVEHLHGGDLEALTEDRVDDLTSKTGLDGVRLDHSAGAVGHEG